jgi:hypothetical protein
MGCAGPISCSSSFPQLGIAPDDLLLGDSPKELIAGLPDAIGSSVDLPQQIVGKIDLDFGHIASIGRGFG